MAERQERILIDRDVHRYHERYEPRLNHQLALSVLYRQQSENYRTLKSAIKRVKQLGAEFDVFQPEEGPPTGKPISIDIFGEELGLMTSVINDMKKIMAQTDGVAKPTDDAATAQPTLEWRVDRARAGMFGLDQSQVSSILQLSVGGLRSGTVSIRTSWATSPCRQPVEDLCPLYPLPLPNWCPARSTSTTSIAGGC